MIKLSVVISARNEERKIEDCLKSVKDLADEIIVIDNSSTDKTSEIAKRFTSKIYKKVNNTMLNVNKNFGFTKSLGDWILSLDADERVTPELQKEIKNLKLEIKNSVDGYYIPRKNIIFGKWIEHSGWYPDHQLRLIRRGKGKFEERHVHEMIKVEGNTGYLKNNILHYNYETVSQFLKKLGEIYALNEAEELVRNGYQFKWQDSIRFPVKEFLSRFFAREGYKDGFHGLMLSLLMAFYHLIVFANIWEKEGFKNSKEEGIVEGTESEIRNSYKEISYWFFHHKLENTKSLGKKAFYKIWRRFH